MSLGIHHQTSCVYTPQQNGIAKRKNRYLLKVARAIMFSMNVPKYYWREAILTATYLINQMPSRVLAFKTPKDVLTTNFPNNTLMSVLPFKLFGCVVYVYIQSSMRNKLDRHTHRCIFIGYSSTQKGYKCYCPLTRKTFVSMDVFFDEQTVFIFLTAYHKRQVNIVTIIGAYLTQVVLLIKVTKNLTILTSLQPVFFSRQKLVGKKQQNFRTTVSKSGGDHLSHKYTPDEIQFLRHIFLILQQNLIMMSYLQHLERE